MTHREKLELMYRHFDTLGIGRSTSAPPAWRLLWFLGLEVPPPLFAPFLPMALAMGSFFAVGWGLLMWLGFWSARGMPVTGVVLASLGAGALFGLLMAWIYRRMARRHGLPSWSEYRGGA